MDSSSVKGEGHALQIDCRERRFEITASGCSRRITTSLNLFARRARRDFLQEPSRSVLLVRHCERWQISAVDAPCAGPLGDDDIEEDEVEKEVRIAAIQQKGSAAGSR